MNADARIWLAEGQTGRAGQPLQQVYQWPGRFPGFYGPTGNEPNGAFGLAGQYMARTALDVIEAPAPYMTADPSEWKIDTDGYDVAPDSRDDPNQFYIEGRVWLESEDIGGLPKFPTSAGERFVEGYKVVSTILTDQGLQAVKQFDDERPDVRADKIRALFEDEANREKFIAQTVVNETNKDGYYRAHFDTDNPEALKYAYQFVQDPEGNWKPAYGAHGANLFQPLNQKFTGAVKNPLGRPGWYNSHMPVAVRFVDEIKVVKFDGQDATGVALPGQKADIDVTRVFDETNPVRVVWRDERGRELKACDGLTDTAGAEACSFDIPEDIEEPQTIRVELEVDGNVVASDSFVVSSKSIGPGSVGDKYSNKIETTLPENATSKFQAENLPDGLTLAKDGTLSGTPTKAGTFQVPVTESITITDPDSGKTQSFDQKYNLPVTITDAPLGAATLNQEYGPVDVAEKIQGLPEGVTPTNIQVDGLPAGLTFADGKISGIPTELTADDVLDNVSITYDWQKPQVDAEGNPVEDADGNPVFDTVRKGHTDKVTLKVEPKDETPAPSITDGSETDEVVADGSEKALDDKVKNPTDGMTGDVLDKDGNPIKDATVTVDPDTGEIKVTVPKGTAPQDGTVVVKDKDGKPVGDPIDVKITKPKDETPAPSITDGSETDEVVADGSEKALDDKVKNPTDGMTGDVLDKDGNPIKDATVTVDPDTGEIKVTVPKGTAPQDGTVVVKDKDGKPVGDPIDVKITAPKTTVEVPEKPKPVQASDEKQSTGVTVKNPDDDTKPSATDEDGKDIPVEVDPETGDVVVTPGEDVDGPITVTIEDPDLDGGKTTVEVPVDGHTKGKDDNNKTTTASVEDPSYGDAAKQVKPGESVASEKPFGDKPVPDGTKITVNAPEGATDWKFTGAEDGTVTAQAPSNEDLAKQFEQLGQTDWDKLVEALTPVAEPNVGVDFEYKDGSKDSADAKFELVGKDGKSILDPTGDADGDGVSNKEEAENDSNPFDETSKPKDGSGEPSTPGENPDWETDDKSDAVVPGGSVTVPNTGGKVPDGTTVEAKGPGKAELDGKGNLVITANDDAKPGEKITATIKDKDGKAIDTVTTTVKADEPSKPTDPTGTPAPQEPAIDKGKCAASAVGFGLPLLALIPIGLATQMSIPGVSEFVENVSKDLEGANAQIQQNLGMFNPQTAQALSQMNEQLRKAGFDLASVGAGIAVIAAGIIAGTIIYDNCAPGGLGGSSVKLDGSSK
ncbi:putative Ig domain-containing protein [Corynebacterium hadale]|nr:putative Ig domain-containing protein [Corynebacterium hadale]